MTPVRRQALRATSRTNHGGAVMTPGLLTYVLAVKTEVDLKQKDRASAKSVAKIESDSNMMLERSVHR